MRRRGLLLSAGNALKSGETNRGILEIIFVEFL
jgi:hypothetical protein